MKPVERLEAAAATLEAVKAAGSSGPWERVVDGALVGIAGRNPALDVVAPAGDLRAEDVDAIITLHRTIDAQIRVLDEGKREFYRYSDIYQTDVLKAALALADAILGEGER